MNSNRDTENNKELLDDIESDDLRSVDDFFKELEAKEKDLHISSDLVIEIEQSEYDDRNTPDFAVDLTSPPNRTAAVEPVSSPSIHIPDTSRFENEILELKNRLSKMEAERVEIYENSQRRNRDFENYKNRTERDRQENLLNQVSNLAGELLPVLDNLDRALECAPGEGAAQQKDFKQFFDGIVLVNQQLNEVLAEMGVQPIAAVGEHFDPNYHEAVAIEETDEYPANVVTLELLRGYRVGEKVIRPSMVKVSTTPKVAKAPEPEPVREEAAEVEVEMPDLPQMLSDAPDAPEETPVEMAAETEEWKAE